MKIVYAREKITISLVHQVLFVEISLRDRYYIEKV